MNTYLLLFILAMCSSLVLTPVVRRLCERFLWLDHPNDKRRVHRRATPRLGGAAIFGSLLVSLSVLLVIDNLLTAALRSNAPQLMALFVPAALAFLLGVYDDLRGTNARQKFVGLSLIAAVFYVLGGRVEALSVPLVGSVTLPPILGMLVTIVWVVGITNAFNLIDGVDGLATGAALFSSLAMMAISLILGRPLEIAITLALSGALIGFLRYNFNPASIFLGDSGALFVGFMLAALSVQGTQKASTAIAVAIPIMAFGLPMVDMVFTMVRRFISGRPIFVGDREHIHHMLLARGWSERRAVLVLYGVCALFGLLALLFVNTSERHIGLVLFVVGAAVVFAVSHLRYHEVDELRASVRRNVGERRIRAANNVRVRRASQELRAAATLADLFEAVVDVLEIGEFVYATMTIGRGGDAPGNEAALADELGSAALRPAELRRGMICWSWERGEVKAADIIGSPQYWALRLPLSTESYGWGYFNLYRELGGEGPLLDLNYLCTLFRRDLARGIERIMETKRARNAAVLSSLQEVL